MAEWYNSRTGGIALVMAAAVGFTMIAGRQLLEVGDEALLTDVAPVLLGTHCRAPGLGPLNCHNLHKLPPLEV